MQFKTQPEWKDLILINFNFQGWLLTKNEKIPGNAGLKDQLLALKWVQNNIKKFGGNPKKVTLAGQSSGGVSAVAHTMSDQSKGKINEYYIQNIFSID